MSINKFFPLRLESIKDLGIAVRDLAQRINNLIDDQKVLTTTVEAVKDDVAVGTGTGDGITTDVSSSAHGLAPQSPGDAAKFLNGDHTPNYAQVKGSDLLLADVLVNDVSSVAHGFAPKAPADATKFLNGAATPVYAQVKGSDLLLADVTANDVSTVAHGFAPKLPNDATKYLDGTGLYSVPAGGGGGGTPPAFPVISNWEFGIDAALSAMIAVDGRCTQINDISGNLRHATNGTVAGRARYVKNGFNFKYPCWVFDGALVQHMIFPLPDFPAPCSVVMVLQDLSVGASDGNMYRDQLNRAVGYLSSSGGSWSIFGTSAGFNQGALWIQNKEAIPASMTGAPCVRIDVFNQATSLICNNNTEQSGNATSSGTIFGGTMNIGNGATPVGTAAKFLLRGYHFYSKALSLAERDLIRAYYADVNVAGIIL